MISQYKENKKEISNLNVQLDKKEETKRKAQQKIYDKYWDLKRKLEDQEREEQGALNAAFSEEETKIKETIKNLNEIVFQVKRILAFKGIAKEPKDLSFEAKSYRNKTIELIDTIKTPCMELHTYIYENGKPKNRYSLAIIGRSIFGRNDNKLIDLPMNYGIGLNCNGYSIAIALKDSPTIDFLKSYYVKTGKLFIDNLLTRHSKVEEEYRAVQENYNTPEWERLYWEDQKEYYEKEYSRGEKTDEYKQVLKKLNKLN